VDSPPIFPLSDCPRILLALTKDWRAGDNRPETLAEVRTALAKLIYALGGRGFLDPATDRVVQQNGEVWEDCVAASRAARDERDKPLPADGRYAVLWFPDTTDASKPAPNPLNWPHRANATFGPIIDADNQPKRLFMFEEVDEKTRDDEGAQPSPGFWPTPPAPSLPSPRLVRILIGSPRGECKGGIAQFLQYALRYDSLAYRLIIAAAVWLGFSAPSWFGLKWWVVSLVANLGFLACEIYASLIGIRFLAGRARGQFGRMLVAMWLPLVVIAVAAYLLFANDQGRELGVGIMDGSFMDGHFKALFKAFYLAPILIYWASNNWLSARIGLNRAFPEPEKEQVLLFWGPRLIGVLAHLLAAVSLSAAALEQPDLKWKFEVAAGPLAILLTIALGWCVDTIFWSKRDDGHQQLARNLIGYVGAFKLIVLATLIYARLADKVPSGFFWGTLSIVASTSGFLITISLMRKKAPLGKGAKGREADDLAEQNTTRKWTLRLAGIMLVGTIAIWFRPMIIGQIFGSLNVACFAFGSFLALTNFLDLMATRLANYGGKHFKFGPRAVAAVFLCFLAIPAFLASWKQSFHRVRLCEQHECTAALTTDKDKSWSAIATPDQRPTVSEAARAWYAQAEVAYHKIHSEEPDKPVPMLIVATAGGGIRAAYWTATILERLEKDLSKVPGHANESLMRNLLFAVSGVSGGSVGAAAYAAAVHEHEFFDTAVEPTNYLKEDFLAPGLASLIFIDGPSNMLPDFGQIDRGKALELGFELASQTEHDKEGLAAHKFLSFFPAIGAGKTPYSWRPALLLNATHQETGRRLITSHIKIERDIFIDSYDALQVLNSDVRLSTAAHNSARFTYVSPAGSLINAESATESQHNRGYIIDGGYFENYGAQTALELARKAIEAIDPDHGKPKHKNKVKLVVLQISSDPTLKEDRTLVRARVRPDGCFVSSLEPSKPDSAPATLGLFGQLTQIFTGMFTKDSTSTDATAAKPTDPANYLTLIDPEGGHANEGEGFVFSYANELSAPLVGIMSVRGAHGTIAAAELAASICQGKNKVEQAMQSALDRKTATDPTGKTGPAASIGNEAPHFSHMAMCEKSLNPPLGWVLSDRTRSRFADILGDCGNKEELSGLEEALGLQAMTASGATTHHAASTEH
jgi:hypothetical protein